MADDGGKAREEARMRAVSAVLIFWIGYVAVIVSVGFATTTALGAGLPQLIVWGFASSILLLALGRFVRRTEGTVPTDRASRSPGAGLGLFVLGLLLGAGSFGIHVLVVANTGGAIGFARVPDVGAMTVVLFLIRFLATSCMEELGFRGYALQRLEPAVGPVGAVIITAIAFGLSHLLYGWDLRTIFVGVIPAGMLWGMSALATRGLAVPIGLHAAWNFAGWAVGSRAETGLLQMTVDGAAVEASRTVGTASYLTVFGVLTLAFWLAYRRRAHAARDAEA